MITVSNALNMFLLGLIINIRDVLRYIRDSFHYTPYTPDSCEWCPGWLAPITRVRINSSLFAALPGLYFLMPLIFDTYTDAMEPYCHIDEELKLGILVMATTSTGSLATVFSSYERGQK